MTIEFSVLEEMFQSIRETTDWNIDGPCLWGYFFTDATTEKLEKAAHILEHNGYRFVDLYEADDADGEAPYFWLHVEKIEVHSPHSLHLRNAELYAFADEHELDAYDGMDVGPTLNS